MLKKFAFLMFASAFAPLFVQSQSLYFPPKVGNNWQTTSPASLDFCPERIDSLYQFLAATNTKGFLLLKDGRIVLEKYFGSFQQDSVWYWASAGKTATAFLVGMAQEEGLLDIEDKTAEHLGTGWTSCPPDKENLITIRHQLNMTSGLDDALQPFPGVSDPDNCTDPQCLVYKADAGSRWAYHNAPYRLLHDVVEAASGKPIQNFTKTHLFDRTGMKGLWVNQILYSTPRSMARFGLLMLANGVWDGDTLLHDADYFYDMTHRSQNLNKSYGYLTWLNGQETFMLPSVQFVFPGQLLSQAPADLYAALGKNDQKIHVVPSKGWVVIRMGNDAGYNSAGGGQVPIVFDNELWKRLNALVCTPTDLDELPENESLLRIFPNPSGSDFQVESDAPIDKIEVFDGQGKLLFRLAGEGNRTVTIEGERFQPGIFWLKILSGGKTTLQKAVALRF